MDTTAAVSACIWCGGNGCDCDAAALDVVRYLKHRGLTLSAEMVCKLMEYYVTIRWADRVRNRYFCRCCGTESPGDGVECFACGYGGKE